MRNQNNVSFSSSQQAYFATCENHFSGVHLITQIPDGAYLYPSATITFSEYYGINSMLLQFALIRMANEYFKDAQPLTGAPLNILRKTIRQSMSQHRTSLN